MVGDLLDFDMLGEGRKFANGPSIGRECCAGRDLALT